jgi:hypothetical protein
MGEWNFFRYHPDPIAENRFPVQIPPLCKAPEFKGCWKPAVKLQLKEQSRNKFPRDKGARADQDHWRLPPVS